MMRSNSNRTQIVSKFINRTTLGLAAAFAVSAAIAKPAHAQLGNVYTSTNAAGGNSVIRLHRAQNGRLTSGGTYPTGGKGTGASLASQGSVIVGPGAQYLYTVDAGSNDIATFQIQPNGLKWVSNTSSGGIMPVSLTAHGKLVYVVNAGGEDNISGFRVLPNGTLQAIPNSNQLLSATGTGAAEIAFSATGSQLVVTEKGTGHIDVFPVDGNGVAGEAIVTNSVGVTPYGFAFDAGNHFLVSEAFGGATSASAVSSYFVSNFGSLPITGSALDDQTAACWVATAGSYAWTANAGSGSISAYFISPGGNLSLIPGTGVVASLGSNAKPTDMAIDASQQYLYVLEDGIGAVAGFHIEPNGTLIAIGVNSSLGAALSGLAGY